MCSFFPFNHSFIHSFFSPYYFKSFIINCFQKPLRERRLMNFWAITKLLLILYCHLEKKNNEKIHLFSRPIHNNLINIELFRLLLFRLSYELENLFCRRLIFAVIISLMFPLALNHSVLIVGELQVEFASARVSPGSRLVLLSVQQTRLRIIFFGSEIIEY